MLIEQIYDEGLAHLSYLIADQNEAVVIDPRIDIDVYIDIAQEKGLQIKYIFETHRNEDYLIGSQNLAAVTQATIYHGKNLNFEYGKSVEDGDQFEVGSIKFKVIETPGHTPESISLVLYESDTPLAVFTGDTLFVGTVGRTDLWKTREEAASILYDSIFNKILKFDDHILVYPGHGGGSVCGSDIAERRISTLGYEKKYNNALQCIDKKDFINQLNKKNYDVPPYFKKMEQLNQKGPGQLERAPIPKVITVEKLEACINKDSQILDVRSAEAYAGAAIPGSLSIPLKLISAFAGWYLSYDKEIILICENQNEMQKAVIMLARLGYTNISHWLAGLHGWEISGKKYLNIPTFQANEVKKLMEENKNLTLLDVRSKDEWNNGYIDGAKHIYVGELLTKSNELKDKDSPILTYCGSGQRAIIAASILKLKGFDQVAVSLGSISAWQAFNYPISKP